MYNLKIMKPNKHEIIYNLTYEQATSLKTIFNDLDIPCILIPV